MPASDFVASKFHRRTLPWLGCTDNARLLFSFFRAAYA
jgi:hypothetical protein